MCGQSVPPRTISRRIDRSFTELRRKQPNVPRRGPLHVGDLRDGAPVGTGVAVALEAPAHTEGCHLRDSLHLVDAPVAGDTADSRRHMRPMREIGIVGQLGDAYPTYHPPPSCA